MSGSERANLSRTSRGEVSLAGPGQNKIHDRSSDVLRSDFSWRQSRWLYSGFPGTTMCNRLSF